MLFPIPTIFSRFKGRWSRVITRWHGLGHYWQHFWVAVLLGIAIEVAIHAAHDVRLVKLVQNAVLDTSLRLFAQMSKPDSPENRLPVMIVVDDASRQSPKWGNDKAVELTRALELVSHAFERGTRHVFLDITFDANLETQSPEDKAALNAFLLRYSDNPASGNPRHLYVARSTRVDPCFPRDESIETLRTAVWDAIPGLDIEKRPGLVIHPVLPHYRADADHVVRGWDLFGVVKASSWPEANTPGGWRFLPSPQLAHLAVKNAPKDSLQSLPWLARPQEASGTLSRASFAAEQVQRLTVLSSHEFTSRLCAHHPEVLGCPVVAEHVNTTQTPLTQQESLDRINALLRPLPAEQGCRAEASKLLSTSQVQLAQHQPHDLLFNRIVYSLPSWEQAPELERRGYYIRTPLTLKDDSLDWSERLVAVGAANAGSGDWHPTPIGNIPGVLINLNAMRSLDQIGPVSGPPSWLSLMINGLIIVAVAAVFSAMSPMAAAAFSAAILIGSLALFYQYLLSRGIWIEFGAPLIGINLHRIIDGYLARRRLESKVAGHGQPMVRTAHSATKTPRKKKGKK